MKLKKGDKLTLIGFEKTQRKDLVKIVFETVTGNKIIAESDTDDNDCPVIKLHVVDEKKLEEELEVK